MRRVIAILVIGLTLVVAVVTPALGDPCVFTASDSDWQNSANWENCNDEFPKDGDSATIPSGKICKLHNEVNAVCDWVDVQGEVRISKGSTLTIDQDSTIDGILTIGWGNHLGTDRLLIAADLTIEGKGGEIVMLNESVIDDNGTSYRLTIQKTPGNPGCDPTSPSCSLVVRGAGGDIKVTLTNNAFVIPNGWGTGCPATNAPITLSDNPKNGSGFWRATEAGHLQVDVAVSGSGTWQMIDEDSDCAWRARITINNCTEVTGDVNLEHGTFVVNQNFCTTGDLTWKSEALTGGGDSIATIQVAAQKLARFGGAGCLTCP